MPDHGIVSASQQEDERQFEVTLRPTRLADFTGQPKLKENLSIAIEAATTDPYLLLASGFHQGSFPYFGTMVQRNRS